MPGFRIPSAEHSDHDHEGFDGLQCRAGSRPGPLPEDEDPPRIEGSAPPFIGYTGESGLTTAAASDIGLALDPAIINAACFNGDTRNDMAKGAAAMAVVQLARGTPLYRIGSTRCLVKDTPPIVDDAEREKYMVNMPAEYNFMSPWWMRRAELDRILGLAQKDSGWAGRVMAAIASVWGSDCDRLVSMTLAEDVYAWVGRPESVTLEGVRVDRGDPQAYWVPEKDLLQLYIPHRRHPRKPTDLWQRMFAQCELSEWLLAGHQKSLISGQTFTDNKIGTRRT